jgi:hypothetical protein
MAQTPQASQLWGDHDDKEVIGELFISPSISRFQQRCCLVEELLDVEGDFKALLKEACPGAGIRCAPYSHGLIKPATDFG